MGKIKYISIDVVRTKREALITKRNDLLLAQRYTEANALLIELQELNEVFNNLLKKNLVD
jgi:hypothetical protein